jgi:sugar transferase (PEP-CTERM/EpsH1 system associated)
MNVLFLTTRLPYPPDSGGKVRDFNLLKGISKKHSVTLVSFIQNEKELEHLQFLSPYCKSLEVVKEGGRIRIFSALISALFTKKPFTIAKFYSSEMRQKIYSLLNGNEFDLIHCSHLHMAQYVDNIKNIPKVIDEHNIEFIIIKRYLKEQKNYIKKALVFLLQYVKLTKYEPGIVRKFDHCFVVSQKDKDNLRSIVPDTDVTVIANGVDVAFYEPQPGKLQPDTLVFTGSMDWFPNEDAILYFYEKIWPLIKRDIKDARLYVVGRNPSNKILNLQRKEADIVVTGYIADVRPYVVQGAVYIVPLRIGGGSRLKIVEAMAMGKAVVSTSIGCEGIDVLDNEDILIADEPEKFAANVIRLLKNNELCNKLGVNARRLAESKYSWAIIGRKLNEVYDKMINLKETEK